jgi:hypothetical protein
MPNSKLTDVDRIRRCQILCGHCIRNIAYYRASRDESRKRIAPRTNFWVGVEGSFLDMAILEWCKLFGDQKGKINSLHGWEHIVGNVLKAEPIDFFRDLLSDLKIGSEDFETVRQEARRYRDKFVAHLDEENTTNIPDLSIPLEATIFLYSVACQHPAKGAVLFSDDIRKAYDGFLSEAKSWFAKASEQE